MRETSDPLRILCIGETWFGSDARAAFEAFRRMGHSTEIIDESLFVPTSWETFPARVLRKVFRSVMVQELTNRASTLVRLFRPDALFVFKGNYVTAGLIEDAKSAGVLTLNFYPDVSFMTHGPQLPHALRRYDHVFNAKSFGIADMRAHGVKSVSFLAPGFDPEVHRPMVLTDSDRERLGCDVSFIGTWSPKKEAALASLREAFPRITMRIWGNQWEKRSARILDDCVMGVGITGDDYARGICASKISLGLLSEARRGASSGDLITARTFQIPACGAFMLHERNPEVLEYFSEETDAAFFGTHTELAEKVGRYLGDPDSRERIARNGRERSRQSDYSIDARMSHVTSFIEAARGGRKTQ